MSSWGDQYKTLRAAQAELPSPKNRCQRANLESPNHVWSFTSTSRANHRHNLQSAPWDYVKPPSTAKANHQQNNESTQVIKKPGWVSKRGQGVGATLLTGGGETPRVAPCPSVARYYENVKAQRKGPIRSVDGFFTDAGKFPGASVRSASVL